MEASEKHHAFLQRGQHGCSANLSVCYTPKTKENGVPKLPEPQKNRLRRAWNVGGKHWFPSGAALRGQNFLTPSGRTYGPLPLLRAGPNV